MIKRTRALESEEFIFNNNLLAREGLLLQEGIPILYITELFDKSKLLNITLLYIYVSARHISVLLPHLFSREKRTEALRSHLITLC